MEEERRELEAVDEVDADITDIDVVVSVDVFSFQSVLMSSLEFVMS